MAKVKDLLEKLGHFDPEAEIAFVTHVDDEPYELGYGDIALESELPDGDGENTAGVVLMEDEDELVIIYLDTEDELTFSDYDDYDRGCDDEETEDEHNGE
jgi:hypothetical protein